MDFVSAFGKAGKFDNILVVVDRLTKMGHLIPTTVNLTSKKCAHSLSKHVLSLHGFPQTIVSDQDRLFKKNMWGAFMEMWGIETRFAVKSHPQTDGQSERIIRTISGILRAMLNKPGQTFGWDELLPMVESAYNNSEHNATKVSPFYANYGFHPRIFDSLPPTDFNEADERVSAYVFALDQQLILHQVQDRMTESQNEMSFHANRHRRDLTFSVGDQVLVHRDSTLLGNEPGRKFTKLWIGPVKVTRVINNNTYEVSLSMYLLASRQVKAFNLNSLKEFVPLTSEFEALPTLTREEMLERATDLIVISEVTKDNLVTHGANTSNALDDRL